MESNKMFPKKTEEKKKLFSSITKRKMLKAVPTWLQFQLAEIWDLIWGLETTLCCKDILIPGV